ncbi:MAG: MBL fold metallo-hydrolase [Bacteroidales bacterium]|nr:MBL fold metallo-hydrolase [Bacteroidales bacterium]
MCQLFPVFSDLCHMPLYIASLNSGSNGNCYYIGNENDAVLIDAGISCRETERRMTRLGLSIGIVRAIFISHEHSDHIRGVEVLSRRYSIPVYMTTATYLSSRMRPDPALLRYFSTCEPIQVNDLEVHPVPKQHDGIDPHSFSVSCNGITIGIFTDIGIAGNHVIDHFSRCHAAFLEANYDETLLERGNYPIHLKRRIRSEEGHLSNDQALEIFTRYRAPFLKLLVLSHLSANNNHPDILSGLFAPHTNGTRVTIASREEATEVFTVR